MLFRTTSRHFSRSSSGTVFSHSYLSESARPIIVVNAGWIRVGVDVNLHHMREEVLKMAYVALAILTLVWLVFVLMNIKIMFGHNGLLEGLEPAYMRWPLVLSGPLLWWMISRSFQNRLCPKCDKPVNDCGCERTIYYFKQERW
jgi:hypothetical protein